MSHAWEDEEHVRWWGSLLLGSAATAWRCRWIEFVDFPRMPRPTYDGAVTPRCIQFGGVRKVASELTGLLGWIRPLSAAPTGRSRLRFTPPIPALSECPWQA